MRMLGGFVGPVAIAVCVSAVSAGARPVRAVEVGAVEAGVSPGEPVFVECPLSVAFDPGEQARGKSKWWISDEGRREFGLSDAQSRDLEAVFQSVMPTLKALKVDVDRYQKDLSTLLGDVKARESDVVMAVDRLEIAQSGLSKTRTLMLFRMYRLLTPEQRAKVQAHSDRRARLDNKDGRR